MAYRLKVDSSQRTHLALCGCSWRGATQLSRAAAWAEARRHELRVHPAQADAARSLAARETRRRN